MTNPTSIQVSDELWRELNGRKEQGDTFEDVIWRELDSGGDCGGSETGREATVEHTPTTEPSDPFSDINHPGGVDDDEARAAIDASRTFIEREGSATKSEIVRAVMPDHELKYNSEGAIEKLNSGERYRGAWWRRVIKPGLEALEDVEKPAGGDSDWRVR